MGPLLVCKMGMMRPTLQVAVQGRGGESTQKTPGLRGPKEVLIFQSLWFLAPFKKRLGTPLSPGLWRGSEANRCVGECPVDVKMQEWLLQMWRMQPLSGFQAGFPEAPQGPPEGHRTGLDPRQTCLSLFYTQGSTWDFV